MNKVSFLLWTCILSLFIFSCDDDNDEPTAQKTIKKGGKYMITTMISNPDGQSGSCYVQLIENLDKASYDNSNAIPFTYGAEPRIYKDWLFECPLFSSNTIKKYLRTDEGLKLEGSLDVEAGSAPTNICILNDQKGYITLMSLGRIVVFNPQTMKIIKQINTEKYGVADGCPDAGAMILRDDFLYVGLNQMQNGYYPVKERPYCDVLIIDTKTDEVVKMITEKTTGISQATRPIDSKSIFVDEKGDIYLVGMGSFGMHKNHKSGYLRIKKGSQEFDSEYAFPVTGVSVEGNNNVCDYILFNQYIGDGKALAVINMPSYQSNPPKYANDKTGLPVIIDLHKKTIKALDLPRGKHMSGVYVNDGIGYFGLIDDKTIGYFTYNIKTGEVSKNAIIETQGDPIYMGHFQ